MLNKGTHLAACSINRLTNCLKSRSVVDTLFLGKSCGVFLEDIINEKVAVLISRNIEYALVVVLLEGRQGVCELLCEGIDGGRLGSLKATFSCGEGVVEVRLTGAVRLVESTLSLLVTRVIRVLARIVVGFKVALAVLIVALDSTHIAIVVIVCLEHCGLAYTETAQALSLDLRREIFLQLVKRDTCVLLRLSLVLVKGGLSRTVVFEQLGGASVVNVLCRSRVSVVVFEEVLRVRVVLGLRSCNLGIVLIPRGVHKVVIRLVGVCHRLVVLTFEILLLSVGVIKSSTDSNIFVGHTPGLRDLTHAVVVYAVMVFPPLKEVVALIGTSVFTHRRLPP